MPESLKNILLVMANGGFLVPPTEKSKGSEMWEETWKRVDRFLPDLYAEIFPEAVQPPKSPPPPPPLPTAAAQVTEEPPPAEPADREGEGGNVEKPAIQV